MLSSLKAWSFGWNVVRFNCSSFKMSRDIILFLAKCISFKSKSMEMSKYHVYIWAFTDLCLIFLASDICLHKHENIEALSEYPPLISKLKVLDEDILFFSGHTWIMFLEHFILFTKTRKGGRFVFGILSFQTELCSGEFELYLLLLSISVTWKHSRRRSI